MDSNEQKLSDFIDRLNAEQKPLEDEHSTESEELQELFLTVKQIRSLRDPAMPGSDFQQKLTETVMKKLVQKKQKSYKKWTWFTGIALAAAVFIIMANLFIPFRGTNIVEAMENAYQDVKAYHGFIEIVETNKKGESITQSKMEVWEDKNGNYYTKGLEGSYKGIITVNNGNRKWQVLPGQKQINVWPGFPDSYRFTFELGNEIKNVKNALSTKIIGEEKLAGRNTTIVEVIPQNGSSYKLWIDKKTRMPLQKQSAMENAIQYKVTYTKIDFQNAIPADLLTYHAPKGYHAVNEAPEQSVSNFNEARQAAGFIPKVPETTPAGYSQNRITVVPAKKLVKIYYSASDKRKQIIFVQGKASGIFQPANNALLGKINNHIAEIQSPIQEDTGILGGGLYAGVTDLSSIRWQQNSYEFAVVGNIPKEELTDFTGAIINADIVIDDDDAANPRVKVPVNLEVEKNTQKSVDRGSSPWKLDPAFVAQVFVSLKISPKGIIGEYPIKTEELKIIKNTGTMATIEVNSSKSPIKTVYLEKLVRKDSTGIWTVTGYDPIK